MISATTDRQSEIREQAFLIRDEINGAVDALINSLPNPADLSIELRRGILARYAAVLEGNFIYWMTCAYLALKSDEARAIIRENLDDEIRGCHPGMLRRFVIAAGAVPNEADARAISREVQEVRLFIGRLSALPILVTMAFFEGFIQKFMAYLAGLAAAQGSTELEYTDVHGVCDVAHTQELFRAWEAEMALEEAAPEEGLFDGVCLLRSLIGCIVYGACSRAEQAA